MVVCRFKPLYMVVVVAVVGVSGCLSDSSESGSGIDDPAKISTTVITSPEQGAGALSVGLSGANGGTAEANNATDSATSDITFRLGKIMNKFNISAPGSKNPKLNTAGVQLQKIMARSKKQLAVALADYSSQEQCDEGIGSVTGSGSGDATNYNVTVSFDNCRLNVSLGTLAYIIVNGTVKESYSSTATSESGTVIYGDGDTNAESSDLVAKYYSAANTVLLSSTISEKATYESVTGATPAETVSLHGRIVVEDTQSGEKDDFVANKFIAKTNGQSSLYNEDVLLNGAIQSTYTAGTDQPADLSSMEYIGFLDFHYTMQTGADYSMTEETIDGKIAVNHEPAQCGDGAYNFVTQAAIQRQYGQPIAGTVMINDNTTVQYNSDGSIDVTVDGQTVPFENESALNGVCLVSLGN